MMLLSILSRRYFAATRGTTGSRNRTFFNRTSRLRPLSSSSNGAPTRSAAQDYIDGLLGLPPITSKSQKTGGKSSSNPTMRARASMVQNPLLLSGSSYLFPTLRLDRQESPQSLLARLEAASPDHDGGDSSNWGCPIILDASALAPDGSPHYQPPPPGSLTEMISILSRFGMHVIGITKLSSSSSLADEAAQAGIPSIWAPRRAGVDPKFELSQVLQLVRQKQRETQTQQGEEQPKESSQAENSVATVDKVEQDDGKLAQTETPNTTIEKSRANADDPVEKDDHQLGPTEKRGEQEQATKSMDESTITAAPSTKTSAEANSQSTVPVDPPVPPVEVSSGSTLYHGSVRSGQQVLSAKGKSLVIAGSFNSGGEVMSDGDIFVFGKLRGRAFAGLDTSASTTNSDYDGSGPTPARIVATSFDAELVAVGDTFMTIDKVEHLTSKTPLRAGQPIMVTRVEDGEAPELVFSAVVL